MPGSPTAFRNALAPPGAFVYHMVALPVPGLVGKIPGRLGAEISGKDSGMARRVRTTEEVEEIKVREKIKFSLVRQQINLNRELSYGGCPTARGKVYITGIFQKNGQLSLRRPQLALRCMIRAHLNEKDMRNRRRAMYDPVLDEAEIRKYCTTKQFKTECRAYRRFIEEATSTIVTRESDEDESSDEPATPGGETPPAPRPEAAAAD